MARFNLKAEQEKLGILNEKGEIDYKKIILENIRDFEAEITSEEEFNPDEILSPKKDDTDYDISRGQIVAQSIIWMLRDIESGHVDKVFGKDAEEIKKRIQNIANQYFHLFDFDKYL